MSRFSQYPVATSPTDYTDATNFLIEDPDGNIKLASLDGLSTFFCSTNCDTESILSADVLTMNSSPVELVPAPGVGFAIEVLDAIIALDFNSAAYTGGTTVRLMTSGNQAQATCTVLDATVSTRRRFDIVSPSAVTDTQIIENAALVADTVAVANTGDSNIQIWFTYRIISV
jgi:hypothetical protein